MEKCLFCVNLQKLILRFLPYKAWIRPNLTYLETFDIFMLSRDITCLFIWVT